MLPPLSNVKHLRLQILCNTLEVKTDSQLMESLRWICPHLVTLAISSAPRHEETMCPHLETPIMSSEPRTSTHEPMGKEAA